MSFIVGWDKRQLSRVGPPFLGFHWWAGARIRSLVPPYLSDDQKVSSKPLLQSCTISIAGGVERAERCSGEGRPLAFNIGTPLSRETRYTCSTNH